MPAIINNFNGTYIEHVDTYIQQSHNTPAERVEKPQAEDIQPIDTSFFCTKTFSADICEKNLRAAIDNAKSKADACRNIMDLERYGYILLSKYKDDDKAKLINPFATHRFTFTGEDFKKARNSSHSFPGK